MPKKNTKKVNFLIELTIFNKKGIIKLPSDWTEKNLDVVSFRYEHPKLG
jgi:hypothetical protein